MKNKNLTLSLLAVTATVMAMQACGGFNAIETADLSSVSPSSASPTFVSLKSSIFDSKCATCHTQFSDYATLVASGYVTSGQPSSSALYMQVSSGTMPLGGTRLSSTDIANIQAWILSGLPSGAVATGPTPVPIVNATPTPAPVGAAPNPNATFTYLEANLFSKSCTSCHNSTSAAAGYNLQTYAGAIKQVVPGNSTTSNLYSLVANKAMPPGGNGTSAVLLQDLQDWITDGALNN